MVEILLNDAKSTKIVNPKNTKNIIFLTRILFCVNDMIKNAIIG